jgi:7,8-dihydroneopterin aldolase/epimerase/oxygenase
MAVVTLENMEFFAYHGFYEEEQKIGNKYSVDISVAADLTQASETDQLSATVNYEHLYKIVAHEMKIPTRLLEHIAQRIIKAVYEQFKTVEGIQVTVAKYNPPIGGVCAKAKVSLSVGKMA